MTIKEMVECIVKGIPVEYKGIKCLPVGYGARVDKRTGAVKREFILVEENAQVDCSYIIGENSVKYNTTKCEIYKTVDIEHRLRIEDIRFIDSIVYRHKEEKDREQITAMRNARQMQK